jgi:hypothetical protein
MTTLTYNPDQGQPEFSDEELNSIAVGEQMEQEQQQLLAGKYESAEELERAYVELQQRFSSNESAPEETEYESEEETEEPDVDLMEALWQQSQDEFDPDTLEQLSKTDPIDIAQAYLDLRSQGVSDDRQLEPGEVQGLYDMVGGQDQYTEMLQWASNNCEQEMIEAYDAVMQKGDPASCFFAVQALAFRMAETEGWQPQDFLNGSTPVQTADVFRSQAEVVAAMQDPRYDNDPAYRQDVMNKLERSDDLMY